MSFEIVRFVSGEAAAERTAAAPDAERTKPSPLYLTGGYKIYYLLSDNYKIPIKYGG